MATTTTTTDGVTSKELNHGAHNNGSLTHNMSHEEHEAAKAAARFGYGPLAHTSGGSHGLHQAFGGEFQPGLFKDIQHRKFANPAPLGLSAFALTTFVLSLINMGTRGMTHPNLVVGIAYGYGGFVQLLAGMWEMAVGNTFGATALSSYGGFWLSFAIILTPGGFEIVEALGGGTSLEFQNAFGLYLMGWFIFTFILLLATLRSTVAFFLLFFFLDLAFLMLSIGHLTASAQGAPTGGLVKAGGFFGLLAAFLAWYNAAAGIFDDSNSFFLVPVAHFPWSAKGREAKKQEAAQATV